MLRHSEAKSIRPERVLILGAGGFVSPHLQRRLAAAAVPFRAVGSAEVDLRSPDAIGSLQRIMQPGDTIVMAAALTPKHGRTYAVLMDNLRMAATVCEAVGSVACRHFVYLSSDAVYDGKSTPIDEDSSREPSDLYGLAHTTREMMLESVLAPRGIPYCCLRPTALYGPGDTHDAYGPNRFVRTALADGKIVLFGQGEERRSHLFVQDAADLIVRAIGHCSSGTLNLATTAAISFRELAELIARTCPVKVEIQSRPRAASGSGANPIVHRPHSVAAVAKAFADFEFTPLEQGIAASIEDHLSRVSRSP